MTTQTVTTSDVTRKLVARTVIFLIFLGLLLFVSAGTVRWPQAWIYLALNAVAGLGTGLMLARHHDPALLNERLGPLIQREQKGWESCSWAASSCSISCGLS
jgi:hypothetical protein